MDINVFIAKFAEVIETENVESLQPNTDFHQLDEWSSISVLTTIAFFDEEFGKEIGESDIKNCKTIQDLFNIAIA